MSEAPDRQEGGSAARGMDAGAAAPRPRSWLRRVLALLAVALIAVGGTALFRWTNDALETLSLQDELIRRLARDVQRVEAENADTAQIAVHGQAALANLAGRLDVVGQSAAKLTDTVQGGRLRVQSAAAELLLTVAAERVQIERDPVGAARILDLADRRLAAANDARLSAVRQALAQERVALLAVPVADTDGAAMLLAALIRQSPQWPLETGAAAPFASPATTADPLPETTAWAQRAWFTTKHALSAMFSLRRDDRGLRRASSVEQELWVRQILMIKLEGARLALLRGDGASFRDLCVSAAEVLAQDYRLADAGVSAARAELQRLSRLQLNPPLPETGRALTLLRAQLDAQRP